MARARSQHARRVPACARTRLSMTYAPSIFLNRISLISRLSVVACVAVATACSAPAGDGRKQESVISGFYRWHLKTPGPGLPTPEELPPLRAFVSDALFGLLSQASEVEARYHAAAAEPVPPLVEGDLFTSLFEGATAFKVKSCFTEDNHASCRVRFTHEDDDGEDEKWEDKLLLVNENNQWRIDDIQFIGNGQSSQQEYLTDSLSSIIKQYH